MANTIPKISIEGVEPLIRHLRALERKTRTTIARKALRAGSTDIFKAARRNLAAVQSDKATGKLLKAMHRRFKTYRQSGNTIVVIGPRRPEAHGHLLEFGTTHRFHSEKKGGKYVGFVRPRPFMRPAFEQNKNRAFAAIKQTLENEIVKDFWS